MPHHLDNFKSRNEAEFESSELDKKLLELSSLFEISQALNSSLNLKSILDTILFVPMGRMMISRGLILLQVETNQYRIENLKGLAYSLAGKEIHISNLPEHPVSLNSLDTDEEWLEFFKSFKIELLIPLASKRNSGGMIGFGAKLTGLPYSDDEIEFLSSLSNIAVQAIENASVYEKLNRVNRELDGKIQELNTLFEIGKELNRIFDQQDILKQLSYSLMGQMLINQFFVALRVEDKLDIVYKKGSGFSDEKLDICREFCSTIPDLAEPLPVNEDNERFSILYDIGVRLIVPLTMQNNIGGYIFLGGKLDNSPFSRSNLDFLSTLANMAMISLENARLFIETLEKKRLEEELNLARTIQNRLLPAQMPEIKGLDVHGQNTPSRQVGGDYFDIIQLNDHEYLFTIADVSGKGMPASLLMSNLQAGLHSLYAEDYPLDQMTLKLNNLIYKNTTIDKYITYFIIKLDTKTGEYEYVNAGHNPPYIFHRDDTFIALESGGIILGMMPDTPYKTGSGKLISGDCLTMFTDGVTEAMDPDSIEFEEKGVIAFFKKNAKKYSSKELNTMLFKELSEFAQDDPTKGDDVTLLTIKCS